MSLATAGDSLEKSVSPLVNSSCIACHDADTDTRLNFENLSNDLTDPAVFRQWEQVFDYVTTGEMPPKSEPRPDSDHLTEALAKLKDSLKAESLAQQQANGRVPSRRLTRLEYAYTVRDLLEIDEGGFADDLAEMLPPESDSGGFDTVGTTQRTSPLHIESWLRAADYALNTAINLGPRPVSTRRVVDFRNAPYLSTFNKRSLTNGGSNLKKLDDAVAMFLDLDYVLRSDHCGLTIETAGYYRITFDAYAYQADRPMTLKLVQANPKKVGPDLLGAFDLVPYQPRTIKVTTFMRPGDYLYPTVHVANGNTWSGLSAAGGADNYKGEGIAVKKMFVEGPLVDQWPPASTEVLLSEVDSSQSPLKRVTDVVTRIAPRAFGRPLHANELESFVNLARPGIDEGRELSDVIRSPIRSVLSSPQFLFFGGEPGKLDDFALANRLSYFLWKSMPDEELFQLAQDGQLSDQRVMGQQVERMLDDPQSTRFVRDFVGQWLRLYDINATTPDMKLYPEFDGLLSDSISKETELFFAELIQEDLSAANLIDSNFTFANRRLAEHYRLPSVQGQEMRKVSLPPGSVRGGILGQASILKLTSNGTFTSPVKRGAYVLTRLLGDVPNPPPPNVGSIEPDTRGATTIRETLSKHKDLETCARCHRKIDPPGFALEGFDAIGGFRTHYRVASDKPFARYKQGPVVDSSGVTAEGENFPGIRGYKQVLLKHTEQVARQLTEQLIVYATGGEIQFADHDEISRIVNETRANGYPVRSIIHQVVQSSIMRNK
ncbi:DUF1592 domain-containing protein [Rosistilla oblonga]|uniref:DUF1592 domain-containing protein n=1 Tax=Rosistilla oblonga TaxID=2527990 RepID=UPI0018D26EA4|nr:DUF1592 domain-containing protein [Rosistilla oblonga]